MGPRIRVHITHCFHPPPPSLYPRHVMWPQDKGQCKRCTLIMHIMMTIPTHYPTLSMRTTSSKTQLSTYMVVMIKSSTNSILHRLWWIKTVSWETEHGSYMVWEKIYFPSVLRTLYWIIQTISNTSIQNNDDYSQKQII